MKIKMNGLYGRDTINAWYQEVGTGCFQFVPTKDFASELTQEEADNVMEHADYYLKLYNAASMQIIA